MVDGLAVSYIIQLAIDHLYLGYLINLGWCEGAKFDMLSMGKVRENHDDRMCTFSWGPCPSSKVLFPSPTTPGGGGC